jgi:glycosyltransferase involved in cell wall biosynthesis
MGNKQKDKPIDALLLAKDDWANTMYRTWRCLIHLGLNCVAFKGNPHPYKYPHEAPIHPSLTSIPISYSPVAVQAPGLETLIRESHVIHLFAATCPIFHHDMQFYNQAKVVVQHGSSAYRQMPEVCNNVFNKIADATIIQCPDLLGLGAKNEVFIYYAVDTDFLQPNYERVDPDKIIIGHFPSNPHVKGTQAIINVIKQLKEEPSLKDKFEFVFPDKTLSWVGNLKRIEKCDIIIETLNPKQVDKKFGEWGNTALEAAALGKVVITNSHSVHIYEKQYNRKLMLQIANTPEQLATTLRTILMGWNDEDYRKMKERTRKWVVMNHSIPSTAERLWEKVYKHLF